MTGKGDPSKSGGVSLWLKVDPFYIGALPVPPHPKLSLHVSVIGLFVIFFVSKCDPTPVNDSDVGREQI